MRSPRVPLLLLPLILLGGWLALAADPPREARKGPTTASELDRDLTATTERLQRLLEMAGKDQRFREVETYRAYTVEDFSARKRIEAERILDIMLDATAPYDLRKAAFDALTSKEAMLFDPDLVLVSKRNARNRFCLLKVVKNLSHRDRLSRQFTHELLIAYYPSHRNDPPVATYDAQNGTRTQWKKAEKYWRDLLK